jgi:hypothetical protein
MLLGICPNELKSYIHTFWKRQNYRESKIISGSQRLDREERDKKAEIEDF